MHMYDANKLGALGLLITDAMDAALGGTSPSAASLLLTLHYRPGITITQLAGVAGIAQPTAVRVLDGLEKRGYLVSRRERAGRSVRRLYRATPLGREALAVAQARARELFRELMEHREDAQPA